MNPRERDPRETEIKQIFAREASWELAIPRGIGALGKLSVPREVAYPQAEETRLIGMDWGEYVSGARLAVFKFLSDPGATFPIKATSQTDRIGFSFGERDLPWDPRPFYSSSVGAEILAGMEHPKLSPRRQQEAIFGKTQDRVLFPVGFNLDANVADRPSVDRLRNEFAWSRMVSDSRPDLFSDEGLRHAGGLRNALKDCVGCQLSLQPFIESRRGPDKDLKSKRIAMGKLAISELYSQEPLLVTAHFPVAETALDRIVSRWPSLRRRLGGESRQIRFKSLSFDINPSSGLTRDGLRKLVERIIREVRVTEEEVKVMGMD